MGIGHPRGSEARVPIPPHRAPFGGPSRRHAWCVLAWTFMVEPWIGCPTIAPLMIEPRIGTTTTGSVLHQQAAGIDPPSRFIGHVAIQVRIARRKPQRILGGPASQFRIIV